MTKQAGMGDGLVVDLYDLSGDVGSLGRVGGGNSPLDVTGINKSAIERRGGLRDGAIDFMSHFNPSVGAEHDVLSALPRTDVLLTYMRGQALGSPAASMVAKQINYDPTRGQDGSLSLAVGAQANGYGLQWGRLGTPGVVSRLVNTNEPSIDYGVDVGSTLFGATLYVHVPTFVGTGAIIALESSSDNGAGDAFAAVGSAFVAVSAPGTARAASSGTATVERYLRVTVTAFPAFTSLSYVASIVRHEVTPT